jgi:hypothetical protein
VHVKNQPAFLTSSTVRHWVATLKVEEFLAGNSKKAAPRKSRGTRSKSKSSHRNRQDAQTL